MTGGRARRRLEAHRARRVCAEAEPPDPEKTFPDDELLALSWSLREAS